MKLSALTVKEHVPQLLIDMTKLYTPYCNDENIIKEKYNAIINSDQKELFVATFNERHIAAVTIEKKSNSLVLSDFAVREVTQQRGIGKFLLSEVKKLSKEQQIDTLKVIKSEAVSDQLIHFFTSQGFSETDTELTFRL